MTGAAQLALFTPDRCNEVSTTETIDTALAQDAVVAIGVSGGKDSQAAALATVSHLDAIGHAGPRVLVHSDLGSVEWTDSLPVCETLANHLGLELIVVRRAAGDMMARWESRWESSVRRYSALETVTLILPWSTPSMRFCTSELKTQVITSALKKRFRGRTILNVTGVRRAESRGRSKAPICNPDRRNSTRDTELMNWNPIVDWGVEEVFEYVQAAGLELHPAYTRWGMDRVSCQFCIMAGLESLRASSRCPDNAATYRRMVALEARSTFGFQGNRWLADVAPELLSDAQRKAVELGKLGAKRRIAAERDVPVELLFVKGKPRRAISSKEARLLSGVRREVADAVGLSVACMSAVQIQRRYSELL